VLGLGDLNNPKDPEGPAIGNGFRNYLRVMQSLKDVRDHSKLNKTTPILLAGLADWGLPSAKAWDAKVGVSLPDTIEFLRQNGLDKLVDGYGVHVYPTGDPRATVPARMAELEKKKMLKCLFLTPTVMKQRQLPRFIRVPRITRQQLHAWCVISAPRNPADCTGRAAQNDVYPSDSRNKNK
jgi:hypothetical protein